MYGHAPLPALTSFAKLNDFRHLMLASWTLIDALVVPGFVRKDANEQHSRAAPRATGRSEYCRRGGCNRSHRYLPRNKWREHNRSLRHRRPMFVVLFSAGDD